MVNGIDLFNEASLGFVHYLAQLAEVFEQPYEYDDESRWTLTQKLAALDNDHIDSCYDRFI